MISIYLIIFLFAVLFMSLFFNRNILSPSNILISGFILAAICNLVIMLDIGSDISITTMLLIILFNVMFMFFSTLGSSNTRKIHDDNFKSVPFIHVKKWKICVAILFQMFALFCLIIKFKEMLGSINAETLYQFRISELYSDNPQYTMPVWISTIERISYLTGFVSIYVLINNLNSSIKKEITNILFVISIVFSLLVPIFGASRYDDVVLIIYGVMLFIYFQIYKNKHSIKALLVSATLLIIGILGFGILGTLIGRTSEKSAFAYYFGGGIAIFDYYIKSGFPLPSSHFGLLTFNNVYKFLGNLHLIDFNYKVKIPFVSINGVSIGNVSSCLIAYYHDFGTFGVGVISSLLGLMFGKLFNCINNIIFSQKKFLVLIYCYLLNSLVLSPYSESIISLIFSAGFYINIVLIYIIFRFYISRSAN